MDKQEFVDAINAIKRAGTFFTADVLEVSESVAKSLLIENPAAYFDEFGVANLPVSEARLRTCVVVIEKTRKQIAQRELTGSAD